MSSNNCYDLVDNYVEWLREQILVTEVDGGCEITTPFLDRHNDFLQIYLIQEGNGFLLTDDGYILSDLRMSGVDINTEKRQAILKTILQGFGIEIDGSILQVKSSKKDLAQKKHSLIQAMLAVNDLFMVAQPRVASFFLEDVEQYLNLKKIRFVPKVNITGKSGYSHQFDFVIPQSDKAPERLIKAINNPSRDNISSYIFSWDDTRDSRKAGSQAYAILNNQEQKVSADSLGALESYGITPINWSERDKKSRSSYGIRSSIY